MNKSKPAEAKEAEPSRVEDARPPPGTGWETLTTPAAQRRFFRLYWACVDLDIPTPVVSDSIDAVEARIAAQQVAQHFDVLTRADAEQSKKHDAARLLLIDFCLRQWADQAHDRRTLAWLADALSGVLDGKDPLQSLGLPPPQQHRPIGSVVFDHLVLAAAVERLHRAGVKVGQAIAAVADVTATTERTVKRARGTHTLTAVDDDHLTALAEAVFVRMRQAKTRTTWAKEIGHFLERPAPKPGAI